VNFELRIQRNRNVSSINMENCVFLAGISYKLTWVFSYCTYHMFWRPEFTFSVLDPWAWILTLFERTSRQVDHFLFTPHLNVTTEPTSSVVKFCGTKFWKGAEEYVILKQRSIISKGIVVLWTVIGAGEVRLEQTYLLIRVK